MDNKQRRIVCAALKNKNSGDIICGPRHFDSIMHMQIRNTGHPREFWKFAEQGFVDQYGKFLTREEAWKVASIAGQILYRCGGDGEKLFSENLY
jgi:hypothetical protein